jgi:hypothetical protein
MQHSSESRITHSSTGTDKQEKSIYNKLSSLKQIQNKPISVLDMNKDLFEDYEIQNEAHNNNLLDDS